MTQRLQGSLSEPLEGNGETGEEGGSLGSSKRPTQVSHGPGLDKTLPSFLFDLREHSSFSGLPAPIVFVRFSPSPAIIWRKFSLVWRSQGILPEIPLPGPIGVATLNMAALTG